MYNEDENVCDADLFKPEFKFYKRKQPPPDMKEVIDYNDSEFVKLLTPVGCLNQKETQSLGLTDASTWKIYSLKSHPGLKIISNPFNPAGQLKWISSCLMKYPEFPNHSNLESHGLSLKEASWWDQVTTETEDKRASVRKMLRWVTLGYHHNWDTKEYSESFRGDMPEDLVALCSTFSTVLGFKDFRAQAAIVNYYHMDSTLAAHTDHSELYMDAPLFSISFGQSAVFLIGGSSKSTKPSAILLRSGDVMVMSSDTRQAYHAVPRIVKTERQPWRVQELKNHMNSLDKNHKKSEHFQSGDQNYSICKSFSTGTASLIRFLNEESIFETSELEKVIFNLNSILDYISNNRINMNVRQVLPPGVDRL